MLPQEPGLGAHAHDAREERKKEDGWRCRGQPGQKRSCLQITDARAGVINMWDETPGLDWPFHRGLLRTSENPGIYIMIHNCIQN